MDQLKRQLVAAKRHAWQRDTTWFHRGRRIQVTRRSIQVFEGDACVCESPWIQPIVRYFEGAES